MIVVSSTSVACVRSPVTQAPAGEGKPRDDEDHWPVIVHEPVGKELQRRFALGDPFHKPGDLGEGTLFADFDDNRTAY
jgi:hypothetical protein